MKNFKDFIILMVLVFVLLCESSFGQQSTTNNEYEKYYPDYHFYPSGDPTGLFFYAGKYYNNWGIASSNDFVHWKLTEQGITRNKIRELLRDNTLSQSARDSISRMQVRLGGSGTIVIDWKNSSGFGINGNPPLVSFWHNETQPWRTQVVGIAYSNDTATTWKRYEKYPILDINSREFRDPHVFWYEPDQKWIMAIGWAEACKIRFYESSNLKDWKFLSEFGPWGAVKGVWECVDFFPLPVDGNPAKIKWVLALSVQPPNGQYFIGDFDGNRFILDNNFIQALTYDEYKPVGEVLFDFERGLDNWEMYGEAFLESPSNQALYRQGAVLGKEGQYFINSYHGEASSIGRIISPEFMISKDFINFKVGGGFAPGKECVNLIVNEEIVRSMSGKNSNDLQWTGWNVSEYRGKKGKIEIVDDLSAGRGYGQNWGFIYADHFMLCDALARTDLEKAFWLDYGPDFYAVRSWNNYPTEETRRIWVGWMGSWRYASVEPVRGIQSIPRSLELKTFPEGIRLLQSPIKELEALRRTTKEISDFTFEGVWIPKKFSPKSNTYELIVEFENISSEEFGLKLCVGENEQTLVGYSFEREELYVNRLNSGFDEFSGLFPQINVGPLKKRSDKIKLHIFIDKCSIEVFGNNGETVISSKIYPNETSVGIELFSNQGKVRVNSIRIWELASTNPLPNE